MLLYRSGKSPRRWMYTEELCDCPTPRGLLQSTSLAPSLGLRDNWTGGIVPSSWGECCTSISDAVIPHSLVHGAELEKLQVMVRPASRAGKLR